MLLVGWAMDCGKYVSLPFWNRFTAYSSYPIRRLRVGVPDEPRIGFGSRRSSRPCGRHWAILFDVDSFAGLRLNPDPLWRRPHRYACPDGGGHQDTG